MRDFLNVTNALADETRLRILLALRRGELCVCQITELLALAPSTVSKHLFLLKHAGLVDSRKAGRWMFYSRAGKSVPVVVRKALDWVDQSLSDSARVREDTALLRRVLKVDPTELCKKQCRR